MLHRAVTPVKLDGIYIHGQKDASQNQSPEQHDHYLYGQPKVRPSSTRDSFRARLEGRRPRSARRRSLPNLLRLVDHLLTTNHVIAETIMLTRKIGHEDAAAERSALG
jgi:hypothetical protein